LVSNKYGAVDRMKESWMTGDQHIMKDADIRSQWGRLNMRKLHTTYLLTFKSWSSGFWCRVVMWLQPECGGSKVLRNIGVLPHHYTASEPRKSRLKFSSIWKHQISQTY